MSEDNRSLIDLALAISDGAPIDWASTPRGSDGDDTVRHLRIIAEIVEAHRRLEPSAHLSVVDELQTGARAPDARDRLPSWGPLRLMTRVGEGVYGEVYRAWDSRLDREVALKLLRRRESQRAAGSSLIEEGRLLARVRHPNVITVYGAERIGDHVGIWMEFIDGATLASVVTAEGPLPAGEVIRVGRELASALDAVHAAGLLHRDVKAQNVMRDSDGRIVLMDFGAGRERSDGTGVAGTPLYLAPELLSGGSASVQSDIYSLGVLLYHLASGAYPAAGRSLEEIREIHADARALPLRVLRPDLPPGLLAVVDRATDPDPQLRYSTAAQLEQALASIDSAAKARKPVVAAVLAAAATLVIAVGVGMPLTWNREAAAGMDGASSAVVTRRISADAGIDGVSSVSSDGRLVGYVDPASGNLALLDLESGRRQPVTAKTGAELRDFGEQSALSPDNTRLAFAWWVQEQRAYDIRLTAAAGGATSVLYRDPTIAWVSSIDWLPDASAVVVALQAQNRTSRIVAFPVPLGAPRVLREYAGRPPTKIAVSPDGRFVAYDAPAEPGATARDVRLVSTDGRQEARLVEHPADDTVVDWTPAGDHLLFMTDRTTGSASLWSIAVSNGTSRAAPELVRPDMGRTWPFRIADDGTYYYGTPIQMEDVYVGTLDAAMGRVQVSPSPVATSFVGANRWPEWSRDGSQLAWIARVRAGGRRSPVALVVRADDGRVRQLDLPLDDVLRIRWSPDGQSILAIGREPAGGGGIYRIDVASGAMTTILEMDTGLPRQVDWSPDQRSIFYSSPATTAGVVRFDLQRRRSSPIYAGMHSFAVSPDGRWIAGNVDDDANGMARLVLASLADGIARELGRHRTLGAFTLGCAWSADSRRMLCLKAIENAFELWRHSIDREPPTLLTTAKDMRHIRLHPDGRQFAFVAGSFKAELWAMQNLIPASAR